MNKIDQVTDEILAEFFSITNVPADKIEMVRMETDSPMDTAMIMSMLIAALAMATAILMGAPRGILKNSL